MSCLASIVATRNRAALLAQTLDAVAGQHVASLSGERSWAKVATGR